MARLVCIAGLVSCIVGAARADAQQATPAVAVRTFTLRSMRPQDAAQLVAPYTVSPNAGVFEAGGSVPAITVRETPQMLARIDSLLRVYDRPPRAVVVRFQLLAASDTATRDPSVAAAVDSALRKLLPFAGYRLISEGIATASEGEPFSLTLAGAGERFALNGSVGAIGTEAGKETARIGISLSRVGAVIEAGRRVASDVLLSTGVSLPLGQTVVVGSAAPGGRARPLILVMRPELVPSERR
jgi:hypothetical protein